MMNHKVKRIKAKFSNLEETKTLISKCELFDVLVGCGFNSETSSVFIATNQQKSWRTFWLKFEWLQEKELWDCKVGITTFVKRERLLFMPGKAYKSRNANLEAKSSLSPDQMLAFKEGSLSFPGCLSPIKHAQSLVSCSSLNSLLGKRRFASEGKTEENYKVLKKVEGLGPRQVSLKKFSECTTVEKWTSLIEIDGLWLQKLINWSVEKRGVFWTCTF